MKILFKNGVTVNIPTMEMAESIKTAMNTSKKKWSVFNYKILGEEFFMTIELDEIVCIY